jgi:single-strand DNA-binding protein
MSANNHVSLIGTLLGQATESVAPSGAKVVKRQFALFNHSYKNVQSENEAHAVINLDVWKGYLHDLTQDLSEATTVLIEGSFHRYQYKTSEGTKYVYSINVTNLIPFPAEMDISTIKINSIVIVGRAGGDPEYRSFSDTSAVSNLTLAVDRPQKDSDPDWIKVAAWDNSVSTNATKVSKLVEKGRLVAVQGKLTFSTYTHRQTGEDVTSFEVAMDTFQLLGSKNKEANGSSNGNTAESHPDTITIESVPQSVEAVPAVKPKSKSNKSKSKAATPVLNMDDVPF